MRFCGARCGVWCCFFNGVYQKFTVQGSVQRLGFKFTAAGLEFRSCLRFRVSSSYPARDKSIAKPENDGCAKGFGDCRDFHDCWQHLITTEVVCVVVGTQIEL